jgi:Cdc6-like AAA superfamily ATPase
MNEQKTRRLESLQYIQSMLGQLRQMAEAERCDMLSYLIEMAYVESSDILRGDRPSRVNEQKRHSAA